MYDEPEYAGVVADTTSRPRELQVDLGGCGAQRHCFSDRAADYPSTGSQSSVTCPRPKRPAVR